ncbi:MAG: hypothetical protein ACSHYB_14765 [Roseibacillus sp.]
MKIPFFALCSLTFTGLSLAQAPSDFDPLGENLNLPKQIRVMVEFIEVPLPELTKLLADPRKSANDGDLREAVGKLITAGTAKHYDTQLVIARSGETATAEAILEYIYPTEYDPFGATSGKTSSESSEKNSPTPSVIVPPTPTAFETRNTGGTLEVQPTIGANNHIIDLRFAPEIVEHVKNELWGEWKGPDGEVPIQMPSFFSSRSNSGLTMIDGQYSLAATASMLGEDQKPDHQRKLLFFVRADILTVGR